MRRNKKISWAWALMARCVFVSVVLAYAPLGLAAEKLQGLYDVEIEVGSQARRDRRKATIDGLKTVFVRISGHASVLEHPQIKKSYNKADGFLKQFSYVKRPKLDDKEQIIIKMEFESALVEEVLRENGLPMWSHHRPTVLVWLATDSGDGRRFVGQEDVRLIEQIQQQAKRRGLVVKLPSLDLEDSVALSPNELWSLNLWTVRRAAARYNADSLLIGRMTELSNGQWLGDWVFNNAGQPKKLDGQAPDLETFMAQGMDLVADNLATRYAIVPVKISAEGVVIRLTGISNFTDYARAINYLEQLAAVRYANPIHVEKNEILVRLIADGQLQQLEQALALGKRLKKVSPLDILEAADFPPIQLNYHWPSHKQ